MHLPQAHTCAHMCKQERAPIFAILQITKYAVTCYKCVKCVVVWQKKKMKTQIKTRTDVVNDRESALTYVNVWYFTGMFSS